MHALAYLEFATKQSSLLLYQQIPVSMILQPFTIISHTCSNPCSSNCIMHTCQKQSNQNNLSDCDASKRLHVPLVVINFHLLSALDFAVDIIYKALHFPLHHFHSI